jgi:general secretion pathway protein I
MLIEVLVALAAVAMVLAAIGTVVATTVRGSRAIQDRLAASGIAETLLAGMSDRSSVRLGRSSGESSGYRWAIDVAPIRQSAAPESNWQPCSVAIEVRATGAPLVRVASIILLPRVTP